MNRVSPLALAAALMTLLPAGAFAQSACLPSDPADGDDVICAGTGPGIEDDGFDDGSITIAPTGTIDGGDRGLRVDDDVIIVNDGFVRGPGDHGIQGDNDVHVTNNGTVIGVGGDGINIDNDGVVINNGVITSLDDDGVQLEDRPLVVNNGTITAPDEGINVNVDFAQVTNTGTVIAGDDGVNAGNFADIFNSGLIQSTGDQDAIDLDSGKITNHGRLISLGAEDGIDFDAAAAGPSLVLNTGRIEGNLAINTDAADLTVQEIVNSGTLIGRGGVAVSLGGGDDILRLLDGSAVSGAIEMGAGHDTLAVMTRRSQVLTFGTTVPETITVRGGGYVLLNATPAPVATPAAVVTAPALIVVDEAPVSSPDRLSRELGMGIGGSVLDFQVARGPWLGTFANAGTIAPDSSQGADFASRGIAVGFGTGWRGISPFIGYGEGASDLDDGVTETRIRSLFVGLGLSGEYGRFSYDAALYAGRTHNEINSPDTHTGSADFDGQLLGISLRGGGLLWQNPSAGYGIDLVMQGDFLRHKTERHALSGLAGGKIGERTTTTAALRVEMGLPMQMNDMSMRPYLALTSFGGNPDDITFSVGGASTTLDAPDVSGGTALALGASFATGGNGLKGRFEVSHDADDNTSWGIKLGIEF
ncbi:autotransporter outer membrane beta-barrel domain-containing protein [Mameliella sp.]|uniref:autotransporter outer membrane beta-barrel domain-containing protein n=2 Tax=Mameliella sp. TaxID=1924940 RepID=UPI003B510CCD